MYGASVLLVLLAALLLAAALVTHALLRPHAGDSPRLPPPRAGSGRVSVIVPARDEARNLPRLLESLTRLDWVDLEILVVDGGSSDGSQAIVRAFAARDPRVRLLEEPPLPPGWVGKSWACHVGRRHASGARLLFTDADTAHAPSSLARAARAAQEGDYGLVTGATRQELGTFWERVAMPPVFTLIYAAGGGAGAASIQDPEHAIGNGQYLLFDAAEYDRIGGHEAVRGSVVEDLALARLCARSGVRAAFFDLADAVRVRMYQGAREMFRGWRKNVATGATHTPPRAYALTVFTFLPGVAALPLALVALVAREWAAAALALAAGILMAWRVHATQGMADGPGWRHALLHSMGYAFFGAVLAASSWDHHSGRGPEWKGRRYPRSPAASRRD